MTYFQYESDFDMQNYENKDASDDSDLTLVLKVSKIDSRPILHFRKS